MKIVVQDGRRYAVRGGQLIEVETTHDAVKPKRRRAPTGQRFAMLTEERLRLLAKVGVRFPAAWPIYCYLLIVNWKNLHQPVKLTNKVLAELGISHDAKTRALPQLERVGLIKVEKVGRQAPFVTPLK